MDKVVLVTGASGDIGAAVAHSFAQGGCRVALGCHTRPQRAQALGQSLAEAGGECLVVQGDVAQEADVERMFAQTEAAFGPVQVLVNCAGHATQKLFCDITTAEWERMLAVHATGSFLCSRRALPAMLRAKEGSIVNVASMWGQVGAACEVHYSAAKGAVIALTKALAKEMGPSGVRVNCVAPGAIEGAMMEGFTPDEIEDVCAATPLGRLGTPKEVAQAVLFLASPAASFITGQVLCPNGGFVV
ncbi:3-oxoacyl-ACP reductase FabG [Ruminococcaceae bacterium OttesenSCG-928-O06]|nr:3-oxoacyl-ACP reductase FabG [Ruminococcaceae bacterium OttesenSCG-928-O06]